ncbi:MAG: topoisomerase C-terminal repeat-containing protein, partial [Kiloniellales bacterium]
EAEGGRRLGTDPDTGQPVILRQGPYGHYVQLGRSEGRQKPKRVSLPRGLKPDRIDLDKALALLALPRQVGRHPETGEAITAGIGRFGPYIKMGATYGSLGGDDDVLTIGLNRAVFLLADAKGKGPRQLGAHPEDGKPVTLHNGRFGPYLAHGKLRASLPRGVSTEEVTVDEAVALLAAKAAKQGANRSGRRPRRRSSSKRPTGRKPALASAKPPAEPGPASSTD